MALGRKTGGRKKGSLNKLSFNARVEFEKAKYDPLVQMILDAGAPDCDPARRDNLNRTLVKYIHPQLSTVTHKGDDDSPLSITINLGGNSPTK